MKENQKYLATIAILSSLILSIGFHFLSDTNFVVSLKNFALALIPNFCASLLSFLILYFYLGRDMDDSIDNSNLIRWSLNKELEKLKDLHYIGAKLDTSVENYVQLSLNLNGEEKDKEKLNLLKTELEAKLNTQKTEIDRINSKLITEKIPLNQQRLKTDLTAILVENEKLKNKLVTLNKLIGTLEFSKQNLALEKELVNKDRQLKDLSAKISEMEQDKNKLNFDKLRLDELLRIIDEAKMVLDKKNK